ncbi:MAG: hypothetical protein R3F31_15015 [Verrucomicrobiales bacterium]
MKSQTFSLPCHLFFSLVDAVLVAGSSVGAQEEVAKGSALRKSLFELARPQIEQQAGQKVLFEGSLKQLNGWAFFIGKIVKGNGAEIRGGDSESGDTVILWQKRAGNWGVVEAETGFTDAFYAAWPETKGVPRSLIGLQ